MKMKKITNLITVAVFVLIVSLGCLLTVFLPKQTRSETERRELAAFPECTAKTVLDGSFFNGLTEYVTDHFALREAFRTLNTVLRVDVLGQPDSGGVFEAEGYLFEPAWPMDEQAILNNTAKMQWITDTYFADKPVYFSIVPDKADFTDEPCLKLDTEHVVELVSENFGGEYIDITDTLSLGDYYRTDTHWQQDKLGDTADALVSGMGGTLPESAFEWITLDGAFHGVLRGRYAKPTDAEDKLTYGVNDVTESAVVRDLAHPGVSTVYVPDTKSLDRYDVFLSGATPIIEVTNTQTDNGKHLVLFRDSFGSSIAPWLLTAYEKITIIDIRYVSSAILGEQTELSTADEVLFLYSTAILNTGGILK